MKDRCTKSPDQKHYWASNRIVYFPSRQRFDPNTVCTHCGIEKEPAR
jgi:hypothetical protein